MSYGKPSDMRQLRDQDHWFQELVKNNIPVVDRSERNLNHVLVARIQDATTGMVCFVEPDLLRRMGTLKMTLTSEELGNLNQQPAWYYTTFVFIPIIDGGDLAYHMFTPAIGTDLGLVVNASEYSHILKLDPCRAENKFKTYGDAFTWEIEGLFFKFDLESRDLQLTNNEEEATHFKFSVPVITPHCQRLSPLSTLDLFWDTEQLCNYQKVLYQRVPLLRDVENHKILVGGISTFDEKRKLYYFNEGLKVGETEHVTSIHPWDRIHFVFHVGGYPEDALSSMRIFTIATFKSFGLVVNEKSEVIFKETTTDHEVQKLTSLKLTAENHLVTEDGKTGLYIDEEGNIKVTLDKANWHHFRHTQFKC